MIAIVNYGMGNVRSAQMALEHVGANADVTSDHARIRAADALVLPGVGAFPKAMEAIRRLELDELIAERQDAGVPLLGVCLGMQLLFDSSTELGGARGLGLLPGPVEPLDAPGLKVPQIGWNAVQWKCATALNHGLPDRTAMYHVHSYAPRPADPELVIGTADYGSEFVTAVGRGNVYGVQFHPEKSSEHGLQLLRNFVHAGVTAAA